MTPNLMDKTCGVCGPPSPSRKGLPRLSEGGFSILEMMVVLLMAAIIFGTALSNLDEFNRPLVTGSNEVMGLMKQARARAISTTSAHRLTPISATVVRVASANRCDSSDFVTVSSMEYVLPSGASFSNSDWEVCFNPRGYAETSLAVQLTDAALGSRTVEVFLGGAIRVLQ